MKTGKTNSGMKKTPSMDEPLEINLREILRSRLPAGKFRFVPRGVISLLEDIIHQDELNGMLRAGFPERGWKFARKILDHLDIKVKTEGLDRLPEGRYMFASNHPLGGLDGIALIAVLGEKYGDDGVRCLVNDLLMNVEPLKDVFLPVNKFGAQGRDNTEKINIALASGMQVLQFPAGLVSRLHPDGKIMDLEWKKAFVAKAVEYGRDIVPVRFEALNRMRFYRLAKLRKTLGIKVNIEQVLLPSELCAARGSEFRIVFGTPVKADKLRKECRNPKEAAATIRELVYRL